MSLPRTLGELQLYYLLQRANLSVYYQTFVQQGGDDVRQLCEAGEEEFLEIMALVGMATKPLHVRRMQKALREWGANPAAFSSLPQFRLAGASPQNSKRKSVSSSENAFPGSKRLRTLTSAPADCYSPNSGKSPAEGVRANQVIGRQLVTTTFPNSGSVEDVDLSRLNDKLATPLKMKDSDPAMGEDERGCGPSNTGRGDSTQLVHHQVATPLCKEDSSQLQRKADLFSLARPVAQEFAYRKTWLSVEEIDDPSVKSITCENQLRAVFQRTIVGECQEEFIKHQDVDSIGYRHNTKGNNGPLSRKPFASQPQAAECHSSAGSSADVAKIASPQDTGNHHDLRSKHRYTGGFEWLSWYQVTSEADRSHVGRRLPRLEVKCHPKICEGLGVFCVGGEGE